MALATKQNVVSNFNSQVRNYIYNRIVWHSGSYPAPSGCPINIGTTYMGSRSLTYMSESDISGSILTASQVVNACMTLARTYTRVRKFTWKHSFSGNRGTQPQSETQISALNNSYTQSISASIDVTAGKLVSLPYFSNLINRWSSLSNNTVVYEYTTHDRWSDHDRSRR